MPKKYALIGFDLEVLELIETMGCDHFLGYVDVEKKQMDNVFYIGNDNELLNQNIEFEPVISVDIPAVREKLFNLYHFFFSEYVSHPNSNISERAKIGVGTVIQSGTLISSSVEIGKGCFINHGASIHHEAIIGDFTILAPKALILGRVSIGTKSYIGAGSIIKQNIKIGSNVIIGAGAVVINDIPDNSTVVGNPAIRYLNKE
jgi:sugar O-acyltransferase (sialic acid O-acetyltransferase NeuD family)